MDDADAFDSRMEKVASIHEDMFSKPPVPRQSVEKNRSAKRVVSTHASTRSKILKPL